MKNFTRIFMGMAVAAVMLAPSVSQASTLTQPQVSAIIALLEAFNVSPAVLAQVEAALMPSPATPSAPVVDVPVSGAVPIATTTVSASAPQAPSCSLSAEVFNRQGYGLRVLLTWTFTPGAKATITNSGKAVASTNRANSAYQGPVYDYYFGPADYEMNVSQDGLSGSCTAHAERN